MFDEYLELESETLKAPYLDFSTGTSLQGLMVNDALLFLLMVQRLVGYGMAPYCIVSRLLCQVAPELEMFLVQLSHIQFWTVFFMR